MHIYKYTCLNCRGRAWALCCASPSRHACSEQDAEGTGPSPACSCLLWGHASIPWGGSGCALKVFSLCKTPSLQTKAFVIVLPGLQKYRSPTTRNVKVK